MKLEGATIIDTATKLRGRIQFIGGDGFTVYAIFRPAQVTTIDPRKEPGRYVVEVV